MKHIFLYINKLFIFFIPDQSLYPQVQQQPGPPAYQQQPQQAPTNISFQPQPALPPVIVHHQPLGTQPQIITW